MRDFIRHPSDIAIIVESEEGKLTDIGYGGLCFSTAEALQIDSVINIRIEAVDPPCEVRARVVWCRQEGDHYEAGVTFIGEQEAYKIRMVEQICQIEHYKNEVFAREGRNLSSSEAALEWIARYAHRFPAGCSRKKAS